VPLRVHAFLDGVPLHDAWAIDLPRPRSRTTLNAFLNEAGCLPGDVSPATRALLRIRFAVGRLLGWDREPASADSHRFANRLTDEDRRQTLVPAGTKDGIFRIVYRFENEQLSEIANRTVRAAASTALVQGEETYRFYFAVYVQNVSRMTPLYMAAIGPFRRAIVYPSLLRGVAAAWNEAYG